MQLALHFEKDAKPGKEETHNRSQYIFTIFFYPLPKIYDVAFPKVSSTVVDGSLHSLFSHQVVLATNEVKLVRASVKLLLSRIFKLLWSNYYLSNSMCSISKFF